MSDDSYDLMFTFQSDIFPFCNFVLILATVAGAKYLVAKSGDWTEEKFRCNLLVSLARTLFLNWLYMNELDYFEIN